MEKTSQARDSQQTGSRVPCPMLDTVLRSGALEWNRVASDSPSSTYCCETGEKLLNLSEPQFPLGQMEM